jgi:hypothetical protein
MVHLATDIPNCLVDRAQNGELVERSGLAEYAGNDAGVCLDAEKAGLRTAHMRRDPRLCAEQGRFAGPTKAGPHVYFNECPDCFRRYMRESRLEGLDRVGHCALGPKIAMKLRRSNLVAFLTRFNLTAKVRGLKISFFFCSFICLHHQRKIRP